MVNALEVAARKRADRVFKLPSDVLARQFDANAANAALDSPTRSPQVWEYASSTKPALYGRLAKISSQVLEAVFTGADSDGIPLLFRYEHGHRREAKARDRRTWHGLQACWAETLFHKLLDVTEPKSSRDKSIEHIRLLWLARHHAIGVTVREFDGALQSDAENGTAQTIRTALSLNGFEFLGQFDGKTKLDPHRALIGSLNPLQQTAGLDVARLEAYAGTYLGETRNGNRGTYTINSNLIRSDMYSSLPRGTAVIAGSIENLAYQSGTIGDVPTYMPGEPIGCPATFDGEMFGMLWRGVVNSLAAERLVA